MMENAQNLVNRLNDRIQHHFEDDVAIGFWYESCGFVEQITLSLSHHRFILWDSENGYLEYLRDENDDETDVQETLEAHVIRQLDQVIKNLTKAADAIKETL